MKALERFTGEAAEIFLENKDMGGGEDRESHQKILGGITSVKKHSNGGSAKFHLV